MPVYQQLIRNTFIEWEWLCESCSRRRSIKNTEDDDHQISAGEGDEVIVHSSVEVGTPEDDIAH